MCWQFASPLTWTSLLVALRDQPCFPRQFLAEASLGEVPDTTRVVLEYDPENLSVVGAGSAFVSRSFDDFIGIEVIILEH
jgi:hypothetical protein